MPTGTTAMTGLRRIGWVNQALPHARIFSLVSDEGSQLVEGPTLLPIALRFPDLRALADPGQVFERKVAVGLNGGVDDMSTDHMVDMSHMSSLTPGQAFQGSLRAFRPFPLQRPTDLRVMLAEFIDFIRFVDRTIRVNGDPATTEIHTKDPAQFLHWGRFRRKLYMQPVGTIPTLDEDRSGRGLPFERAALALRQFGVQSGPAMQQGQTECPVPLTKGKDPLVVVDRGGIKRRVHLGFDFERGTDPRNGPNRQVGRQPKLRPDVVVAGVLHLHFVGAMDGPGDRSNGVTGVGKRVQCGVKFSPLFGARIELTDESTDEFHAR